LQLGGLSIYGRAIKVNVHESRGDSKMTAARETAMSEPDVTDWLAKNLTTWRLEDGWVRRTYKTNSWKGTLMVVNTVGHLAEAAWHHPDMTLSYAWVEVRLMTHSAKGITDKDLALAKKIEDVVCWQPAKDESNSLEGTPATDMRFAYIKYD
jgi:4a-hydroxytetrahydrobiopterin dehydratase